MSTNLLLLIIFGYFLMLMIVSRLTSRKTKATSFFDGDHKSPWLLVAFGMIGSGISAVSLVSIPGNVGNENLYYFQFILGTILGYIFIAFILIPIFFKQKLVSIYTYLQNRFGEVTYKTGASFFMVSQSFGAALRLLLSVKILQAAFFDKMNVPPAVTILLVLLMIWLYTNKSGIKTIVWTDALQSLFLILVIVISIYSIVNALETDEKGVFSAMVSDNRFKFFDFEWNSGTNFFKQFISGFLITVALVGLDQSMMQKTLTVSNATDAKRNVLTFSFFIAAAQTLFLFLGVLLYMFATQKGLQLPSEGGKFTSPDELFPTLTMNYFGSIGVIAFFIGVVASTFASIDSCIAALTTSLSYDFFDFEKKSDASKKKLKNTVLIAVNLIMYLIVLSFWNSEGSIINSIFKVAGYTYGPLLGIFLIGLFTKIKFNEKFVPYMAITAPVLTFGLNYWLESQGFSLGFLNILINAIFTIILLWIIKK
ncbi:MAG: sodium:solute symporter [Cytophagaceae bacterium]|nr:sodium:solute symporter [Cytophagaceae bacterium]